MIKAHQEMLKKLSPEMREAVKPFIKEYEALSKGEVHTIRAYFGYIKSDMPETDVEIKARLFWQSDLTASFERKSSKKDMKIPFCDYLVEQSPELMFFNDRIRNFINETEAVGKEKFGDKDALWNEFFWNSPLC